MRKGSAEGARAFDRYSSEVIGREIMYIGIGLGGILVLILVLWLLGAV